MREHRRHSTLDEWQTASDACAEHRSPPASRPKLPRYRGVCHHIREALRLVQAFCCIPCPRERDAHPQQVLAAVEAADPAQDTRPREALGTDHRRHGERAPPRPQIVGDAKAMGRVVQEGRDLDDECDLSHGRDRTPRHGRVEWCGTATTHGGALVGDVECAIAARGNEEQGARTDHEPLAPKLLAAVAREGSVGCARRGAQPDEQADEARRDGRGGDHQLEEQPLAAQSPA
mmetsp:Transcript_24752/g.66449  ORF Transcript_24752/g.66449 Transcript_24752/m.66449 type:complete len:232 (+) Transcript_24752:528-1223(+)